MSDTPSLFSYDATLTQRTDLPPNSFPDSLFELEDFAELSHLTTFDQPYLTGHDCSVFPSGPLGSSTHRRSTSAPPSPRHEPVASRAMLEANIRRRRHSAQFECEVCKQTFTALFSLKRHQQSHISERPFACGIPGCTARFYNSSDCKRHEKSRRRHQHLMMQ